MNIFSRRSRPVHMGKFPMEKIRRVARPAADISGDVQRIPKPSKPATGESAKTPLGRALQRMSKTHDDIHDGPVASEKAPISDDPREIAEHIKSFCYFLDADIVGICEIPEHAWYSHDSDGTEIFPDHRYAIVIAIGQREETLDAAFGADVISAAQGQRADLIGTTIACTVADYIRQLGWPARAHTATKSDVLPLPLTIHAGIGELSRIGERVSNPFLGSRFNSSVITTDLPMTTDQPIA